MGRNIVDIPEVFKQAFEEDDGRRGRGGDDDGGRGPGGDGNGGGATRPWWVNRWVWISGIVLIFLLSFNWIISTYTEWLWFSAQSYRNVWLIQWGIRIGSFVIFFVIAALILVPSWRIAYRNSRRHGSISPIRLLALPGISTLVTVLALFAGFVFALAGSSQWEQFLLYYFKVPFGTADPIFGLDLSFFLFELPVYRFLQSWFSPLLVITLIGTAALYLADNWTGLQRGQIRLSVPKIARRHLAILGTLIFLLWASGYLLDIYELLYSRSGVTFGASYTDINATRLALTVQTILMVLLAVMTGVNVFRQAVRPLLASAGLWLAATVILAVIYPSILQRYTVEPNELSRERQYIQHNIDFTRLAFGLDEVDARPFGSVTELTNEDLLRNQETLLNVRVWDDRPLQQTYAQLQELRPYYEFSPIDIDRYEVEGETRQVMLAARELNKANLSAPTWVNRKLQFTHGYGVVMNPVDQVTLEGRPNFFIKDLPPRSSVDIVVDRPQIYFGEMINDVVFVGSGLPEFDYPTGTETGSGNAETSYDGEGGVVLSNIWRRLAFAIRLGETNLLLSDYITPETRVLLHRQIRERVRQIAPFLAFDNDPYLVIADGRLVWMIDAYTLSNNFPYSTPAEMGFNYIRNAVKITIDAYDGTVDFYIADPDDPLIRAYDRAFPDLFHPLEEMPEELLKHIRYPKDLFNVQTKQYLKYHMTDTQVFYNQEDLWEIPMEIFDTAQQLVDPYYVIMSLPDEEGVEFLLIQPYTPAGKDNMIAWLAARSDPPNYGELVAYELPKQELAFGPTQVESRVDQDPEISAQISLWNQRGSRVIRGNLLVIPMGSSFLYVEPLYLLAETSELPELKRVIVASGDRIAMRETLEEALTALVEARPSVAELEAPDVEDVVEDVGEGDLPSATSTPQSQQMDESIEELIESANVHFEAAETAQMEGDWATYGRELNALRQDLERLIELTGAE